MPKLEEGGKTIYGRIAKYENKNGAVPCMQGSGTAETMSVPEMRKLLGLKKTESYWLVHRNFFKTEILLHFYFQA